MVWGVGGRGLCLRGGGGEWGSDSERDGVMGGVRGVGGGVSKGDPPPNMYISGIADTYLSRPPTKCIFLYS